VCGCIIRGVHGKARRVPVQPPMPFDCDGSDADCTINEIRGELFMYMCIIFTAHIFLCHRSRKLISSVISLKNLYNCYEDTGCLTMSV